MSIHLIDKYNILRINNRGFIEFSNRKTIEENKAGDVIIEFDKDNNDVNLLSVFCKRKSTHDDLAWLFLGIKELIQTQKLGINLSKYALVSVNKMEIISVIDIGEPFDFVPNTNLIAYEDNREKYILNYISEDPDIDINLGDIVIRNEDNKLPKIIGIYGRVENNINILNESPNQWLRFDINSFLDVIEL